MKVLAIAVTALRRIMREHMAVFGYFVMPLLLILLLGLLYGDPSYRVGLVVGEGPFASELAGGLRDADGIEVVDYADRAALLDAVAHDDRDAGLIIPAGYDAALAAGEDVTIEYLATSDLTLFGVAGVVEAEVIEQASQIAAARFAGATAGASFEEGLAAADAAAVSLSQVEVVMVGVDGSEVREVGMFDEVSYRMLVLFVFLAGLASGASQLIRSRDLGMSRRMLGTPTSARTIITGETAGRFLLVFVQSLVIVILAAVVFGVSWGNWAATLSILVAFAVASAGAGMLLGAIFRKAQLAESVGVTVALAFALVGGSMGEASLPVPHAFANEAFAEVIVNGAGLSDIASYLGVLALFAAAFIGTAAYLFRRTITGSHA